MSLIESLRAARETPATALHEFLTKYNPATKRIHVFVEGGEDKIFYKAHFRLHVPQDHEVLAYACGNKDGVYEIYNSLRARRLNIGHIYWCVDKDLSELIPEVRVVDDAIFVTTVYSIENYFVTHAAVEYVLATFFKVRGATINTKEVLELYDRNLRAFHRRFLAVMAWIVLARREAQRPNLSNINVGRLVGVSSDLEVTGCRKRTEYLVEATSIMRCEWSKIRRVARELNTMNPKRYVRGKCELWLFVMFIKQLRALLDVSAAKGNGTVRWVVPVELSNAIALLANGIETPSDLRAFVLRKYPQQATLPDQV